MVMLVGELRVERALGEVEDTYVSRGSIYLSTYLGIYGDDGVITYRYYGVYQY